MVGDYELLDFLIWPEGLRARVSLKKTPSLAEFLRFLKEKSAPVGKDYKDLWEDEPLSIKLVPPEKLLESTRSFLEVADSIRRGEAGSGYFSPSLFFLYQNPRFNA